MRKQINGLNAARKGSLFESFYCKELDKNARLIRHLGVNADVEITSDCGVAKIVDLKFWKNCPRPKGDIEFHWLDYLTNRSIRENCFRIFAITRENREPQEIYSGKNEDFEIFAFKWMDARRNRTPARRHNGELTNEAEGKKIVKDAAKRLLIELFPNGLSRLLVRQQRSACGPLTMAPELIPDDAAAEERMRRKFKRTVLFVYSNDGTRFIEYWTIDHEQDLERVRRLLVDDGLNRRKLRISGDNFPKDLKTPFAHKIR